MNPRLIGFVFRSLRASLRGDRMTHALTLSTVCASLALVGAVHLVQQNLVRWAEAWAAERTVVVFVAPSADAKAREELAKRLRGPAGLDELTWRTPEQSAGELAGILGMRGAGELEDFAPWVLEAVRTDRTDREALDAVLELETVLHLDEGTVVAERMRRLARSIRIGGAVLSVLLLLGAFLVVSNTVGLALNARRDEVEIMDLVGTPIGWIYTAYVAEGVLLGTLGAAAAVAAISLPLELGAADWLETVGMPPIRGLSGVAAAALVALGAWIGAAGSAISVRRFLKREWE